MSILIHEQRGGVLLLTLNRPERLNALNRAMLEALDAAMNAALAETTVRAIVITGAGDRAFCAGADISVLQELTAKEAYAYMRFGQGVFDRIENLPKPVIAAVNGYALGGGCELALACDLRFAADTARFALPEITLANLPGWGGTQRLPRVIGLARAKALILTGDQLDAPSAERYGLVNGIYPRAELLDAALTFAARVAERAPAALAAAKASMHTGLREGQAAGMEAEAAAVTACWGSVEQQAALAEFLARRAARSATPKPVPEG